MSESLPASGSSFEFPDESGYPDGQGILTQDQAVLIDDVMDDRYTPEFDFYVVNDEKADIYEAIVGDTEIAGVPYRRTDESRLVLLSTSVYPEYRKQGVATQLIRRVLDDVRQRGLTVTVMCPVFRTFIDHNPGYADLVDSVHPGLTRGGRHD